MVTVFIHHQSEQEAHNMALALMDLDLAVHASIDKDNNSYTKRKGQVKKEVTYVLTLQTKALLFDKIVDLVLKTCGEGIRIYSVPITQCNLSFAEAIRNNTERI